MVGSGWLNDFIFLNLGQSNQNGDNEENLYV